jgi:integrase
MSVRQRKWTTKSGEHQRYIVDYTDQEGKRRHKTFQRQKDARDYETKVRHELGEGTHVADSASITVKDAGALWLKSSRDHKLEHGTLVLYEQQLRLHIVPFLGRVKLSRISTRVIRAFQDQLHDAGRSQVTVRGVTGALGAILADAQERGLVMRNAVRELRSRRRQHQRDWHNGKLKVGIDIPTPEEIRLLLATAHKVALAKWRPLLLTAVFTGLRASELRGLRWLDIDLQTGELHVRQRADQWCQIGRPKSAAGERTVPLPPTVIRELREWKLRCQHGKHGLVFPTSTGNIDYHANVVRRGLWRNMQLAGLMITERNQLRPKYRGLHALRHFFASWCINRKVDGGLELPLKVVQERLGHSSVTMTADVYGHLFPRGDDSAELAAAERLLLD